MAARAGRGRHLQPDGGRGHRRDLPLPDLAVDQRGRRVRERREGDARAGPRGRRRGTRPDPRGGRRGGVPRRALAGGARPAAEGVPGRGLRRLPHAAGVRAAQGLTRRGGLGDRPGGTPPVFPMGIPPGAPPRAPGIRPSPPGVFP
ncbi:hypothetical protein SGPA1_10671 [Streptomyces misionensis JCM 4497]